MDKYLCEINWRGHTKARERYMRSKTWVEVLIEQLDTTELTFFTRRAFNKELKKRKKEMADAAKCLAVWESILRGAENK